MTTHAIHLHCMCDKAVFMQESKWWGDDLINELHFCQFSQIVSFYTTGILIIV